MPGHNVSFLLGLQQHDILRHRHHRLGLAKVMLRTVQMQRRLLALILNINQMKGASQNKICRPSLLQSDCVN